MTMLLVNTVAGICIYDCSRGYLMDHLFKYRFQEKRNVHAHDTRNFDNLYALYGAMDKTEFGIKIVLKYLWNSLLASGVKINESDTFTYTLGILYIYIYIYIYILHFAPI